MKRRKRRKPVPLPVMLAELTLASWQTIGHRTRMMALGTCSPAEYRRMVREKAAAARATAKALTFPFGTGEATALLAPWHSRATRNAKRLSRK